MIRLPLERRRPQPKDHQCIQPAVANDWRLNGTRSLWGAGAGLLDPWHAQHDLGEQRGHRIGLAGIAEIAAIRIISARKANGKEVREYEQDARQD